MNHGPNSIGECVLTEDDKYYLLENRSLMPDFPDDPQAQRVYAVDENVIKLDAPVWSGPQVEEEVRRFAIVNALRVRLCWRRQVSPQWGASAFVGRGGGVVLLEEERSGGSFVWVDAGQHLAAVPLHELAHILTPQCFFKSHRYNTFRFQSHGPEFVRCYLTLLAEHMDTRKAAAAFEYMGV